MATKQIYKYILAIALPLLLFSCKSTRWVKDGEFLLVENEIYVNNKKVNNTELQSLLKQRPNKKLTPIFRPYLSLYNAGNPNKEKGLAHWFTKIGEAPVIADSTTILGSSTNLGHFYFSNGYFENVTSVTTQLNVKKKKAKVRYDVYTGTPHYFGTLNYLIASESIEEIVLNDTIYKTLIRAGDKYSTSTLEAERENLVQLFRNSGYFGFPKELIRFEADTINTNKVVNLTMVISNQPVYFKDSTYLRPHHPYTVSDVYIDPYYSYAGDNEIKDTIEVQHYNYLESPKNKFNAKLPISAIHFEPGEIYNQEKVIESYSHLSSLRVFRNSEILFEPSDTTPNNLMAIVRLKPFPQRSIQLDLEGTNTSGRYGIFGTVSVLNRNLFKNGEIFDISLSGGFERQLNQQQTEEQFFNVYEYGVEVGVNFPRFFVPKSLQLKVPKRILPKSRISTAIGRQNRQEFTRNYFNIGLGYFWKHSKNVNFAFQLLDFSFLDLIRIDPSYANSLEFSQGYQDVLISATRLSYIFNNQKTKKGRNTSFFIASAETAGNFLDLIDQFKPDDAEGKHKKGQFFNVPYSQYLKLDLDYRHYTKFREGQSLVWRIMAGYTYTYGNSKNVLPPFEKSYFAGGSNDIRGFRAYRLGPGNYPKELYDNNNVSNQDTTINVLYSAVAPVKLMFNLEYRFTILKALKGGLFWDMGNIWFDRGKVTGNPILDENADLLRLSINTLGEQIAMSPGFGLRYDFGFFVIRLDAAIPFFDPTLPVGHRLTLKNPGYYGFNYKPPYAHTSEQYDNHNYRFNLAIGYPF